MNYQKAQLEYDKIYSYFKTTCEPFDLLEWNGKILNIWSNDKIIEIYKYKDLKEFNIFSIKLVKSGKYRIV
ncbi:MAG: hypothetical protein Q7R75_01635 [bacterium]|nr:hypothetical protein [bacterium]